MECAFAGCEREHVFWIKIDHDSSVVPMCRKCAETESEKYHVSFENSRDPEEVDDYEIAYDPDLALAEELIEACEKIEEALSNYEGDEEEPIKTAAQGKEKISEAASNLPYNSPGRKP